MKKNLSTTVAIQDLTPEEKKLVCNTMGELNDLMESNGLTVFQQITALEYSLASIISVLKLAGEDEGDMINAHIINLQRIIHIIMDALRKTGPTS